MTSFPIFVDVSRGTPLIYGSGEVAVAKVRTLLKRAPDVVLAARSVPRELRTETSRIRLLDRPPAEDDIKGRPLVISAAGDDVEDARVSSLARSLGVPVNVPDKPELCTFALGALVDRADVTIAIGTDGAAPILVTHLRSLLEQELHPRLGRVAAIAREFRRAAKRVPAGAARRAFWQKVVAGPPAAAILRGDEAEGCRLIEAHLDDTSPLAPAGRAILIGAGPGDPELLTFKAVRALKSADVILHDSLVGAGVHDHARREAVIIDVGKRRGRHGASQSDINALLIEHAKAGKVVARLKVGDAFVFGRAAEEIAAVEAAGIAVEIVPGITAAQACAVDARLPLTSRGAVPSDHPRDRSSLRRRARPRLAGPGAAGAGARNRHGCRDGCPHCRRHDRSGCRSCLAYRHRGERRTSRASRHRDDAVRSRLGPRKP
jgi:uroporphyrin-III C-methyltransferase/precorrin-2 dehydrogenase/sirohydrochlorin ferrochelatase